MDRPLKSFRGKWQSEKICGSSTKIKHTKSTCWKKYKKYLKPLKDFVYNAVDTDEDNVKKNLNFWNKKKTEGYPKIEQNSVFI
jgi:hypothetical protein